MRMRRKHRPTTRDEMSLHSVIAQHVGVRWRLIENGQPIKVYYGDLLIGVLHPDPEARAARLAGNTAPSEACAPIGYVTPEVTPPPTNPHDRYSVTLDQRRALWREIYGDTYDEEKFMAHAVAQGWAESDEPEED